MDEVKSRVAEAGAFLPAGERAKAPLRTTPDSFRYDSSGSSSKPISSKLETSVKMPSGPDSCEEDRYDEDLEDLEPDSSGGELGVVVQMVVIS